MAEPQSAMGEILELLKEWAKEGDASSMGARRLQNAVEHGIEQLRKTQPAHGFMLDGMVATIKRDGDEILASFERALRLTRTSTLIWVNYIVACSRLFLVDEELAVAERAHSALPDDPQLLRALFEVQVLAGRWSDAIASADRYEALHVEGDDGGHRVRQRILRVALDCLERRGGNEDMIRTACSGLANVARRHQTARGDRVNVLLAGKPRVEEVVLEVVVGTDEPDVIAEMNEDLSMELAELSLDALDAEFLMRFHPVFSPVEVFSEMELAVARQ